MLTYTETKRCIEELDRRGLEDLIKQCGEDVIKAGLACDVEPSNIEEAYAGQYSSDEEFVQELLEQCGDIPKDLPSYIHIDWESTARDIMLDYSEDNGFYFRNL